MITRLIAYGKEGSGYLWIVMRKNKRLSVFKNRKTTIYYTLYAVPMCLYTFILPTKVTCKRTDRLLY